jgi:hypothetical protein
MATRIVLVSDTHCGTWDEVHPDIRSAVAEADIAVHCGDFTRMDVVNGVRRTAARSVVVHGNSDPVDVRRSLPYVETFDVDGVRIGATHPAWGGPPFELAELLGDFPDPVDLVLFGHLHEMVDERRDGVRFVSPGQGYASFMVPATIALLTIDGDRVSVEMRTVEPAR